MSLSDKFEHVSVLLEESIDALDIENGNVFLDGTTGGAGHSKEIYKNLGKTGLLLCLDKDQDALETAQARLSQVDSEGNYKLVHKNFAEFDEVLEDNSIEKIDGILLDLGMSSWQIDEASRGFSYMNDGPLDMRMDYTKGESAEEVIARISEEDLANVFFKYGEERNSRRIASAIVRHRDEVGPITSTGQLANIIINAQTSRSRREKGHPAKRCFQALRIYVNGELDDLENFLKEIPHYLNDNARVCIISFHSLEDRLVKEAYRKWEEPCECPPNLPCVCFKKSLGKAYPRNGIKASDEEINVNSRSKSARLRTFIRNSQVITNELD